MEIRNGEVMKRIALCIGNDKYSILPELKCAVADATAMASKLKGLGFDTELKTDLRLPIRLMITMLCLYIMLDMVSKLMEKISWPILI